LANDAGLALNEPETMLLAWVSEVVIWKARYSVPTNTKYGDAFFHRLDNISLADAEACIDAMERIFERTKAARPPLEKVSEGFDLLISWRE
jgi:hypothetical protein